MTKIQFCISHQGKFVFRTEPDEDPERIERTQQGLLLAFKSHRGYKITREAHTTTRNTCDLYPFDTNR